MGNLFLENSALSSEKARKRLENLAFEPLFLADWMQLVFIHFEVDPVCLQQQIPVQLDLFKGRAYVSLVAFSMERMRFRFGGGLTRWLTSPISSHGFLNIRTYVRHHGESGIYFMTEFVPNRLSVFLGPRTFALPYKLGHLDYAHTHEEGKLSGTVTSFGNTLKYEAEVESPQQFKRCQRDTLETFLLERYTAFTAARNRLRYFHIWHEPWLHVPVTLRIIENSLLEKSGTWYTKAKLLGAHYSSGVNDVWMGRPRRP